MCFPAKKDILYLGQFHRQRPKPRASRRSAHLLVLDMVESWVIEELLYQNNCFSGRNITSFGPETWRLETHGRIGVNNSSDDKMLGVQAVGSPKRIRLLRKNLVTEGWDRCSKKNIRFVWR